MTLEKLRKSIDEVDDQLVHLLHERARLAQKVGAMKGKGLKYRPDREAEVIRRILRIRKGPFREESLTAVYREIIAGCLALEQPLRISYLGPVGTYSEEAARMRFGTTTQLHPCDTLDDVVRVAENQAVDLAVVPVENSTEGAVNRTLDLLLETPLTIVGELELPIHHQLLTRATALSAITTVAAHPQALAQCRTWLQQHLPHAKQLAMESNALAARKAVAQANTAAIAGKLAARQYDLPILARNIQDDSANTTRFLVLGDLPVRPTGQDKTSLICSVPNRPGGLGKLLAVLSDAGINMTKLLSRPSPTGVWEYVFYIDLDGHKDDDRVAQALEGLAAQALFVKILGSYPRNAK